jgi:hypothetical protein
MLVVRTSVIERRERTKPHTSLYVRFHFAESREASFLVAALASVPLNTSTENEGTAPSQAGVDVLVLLLLLVLGQNLVRILASVVRSVGICDANVEDSPCSAPPESLDADVARRPEVPEVALRLEVLAAPALPSRPE